MLILDSFSVLTSDENDTDESKKYNEDSSDKDIIVIEERIVSAAPEQEFISLEELADSDYINNRYLF